MNRETLYEKNLFKVSLEDCFSQEKGKNGGGLEAEKGHSRKMESMCKSPVEEKNLVPLNK